MKRVFYLGIAGLVLFEILRVYLIMPMPGSQGMESLDAAFFLHRSRWVFRVAFALMIIAALPAAFRAKRKWPTAATVFVALGIVAFFNFQMTAERMFKQPRNLVFKGIAENGVDKAALVIGVEHNGEAKAYPVRFLVYHHQVPDTIGGKPILVSYCSVCRTGRVFEPIVSGHAETFRLVGMDHFNAMFEDATTGSWWRQATGEAVTGPLKGSSLPEFDASQMTLEKWTSLHPTTLVMQPDPASQPGYDTEGKFERGESKGKLTRMDPESWRDKSWIVGIEIDGASKAYDWNTLKSERVINDSVGGKPIVLVLAMDKQSFAAFERPSDAVTFTINDDVLAANGRTYDFTGRDLSDPNRRLARVSVSQEFWHSWRTFHPNSGKR